MRNLTIREFHAGLTGKKFSATEAAREFLSAINKEDQELGAFLEVREDKALEEARAVDDAVERGGELDFLAGVPLAVKDNMVMEGERTTAGSRILENYTGAYDATVIKKLKQSRAVILGKTNLDEFAMGSSTENSAFQVTKNPRDKSRVPGGSSGGSAAAVAARLALAALGSDTGGSIRQPANFCGVVGLKPTYGAVSRFGLIAMASSLDQIGPIAQTVEDAEILFNAIRGHDPLDATSVEFPISNYQLSITDVTIGLPKEYFVPGMDAEVERGMEEAMGRFKKLGARFKEISLPHTPYALSVYYIIVPSEVSANLARFDGLRYSPIINDQQPTLKDIYTKTRGGGFGAEAKRRVLLGTFVLSHGYYDAYYLKAQRVRQLIRQDFERVFDVGGVDMILAPVSPTLPFKIGEKANDPLAMYLSDIFTIPINLAGLPSLAMPVKRYWMGDGVPELPVGFQLIGKPFRESEILAAGKSYEADGE